MVGSTKIISQTYLELNLNHKQIISRKKFGSINSSASAYNWDSEDEIHATKVAQAIQGLNSGY